jgi:hypothetical protein
MTARPPPALPRPSAPLFSPERDREPHQAAGWGGFAPPGMRRSMSRENDPGVANYQHAPIGGEHYRRTVHVQHRGSRSFAETLSTSATLRARPDLHGGGPFAAPMCAPYIGEESEVVMDDDQMSVRDSETGDYVERSPRRQRSHQW